MEVFVGVSGDGGRHLGLDEPDGWAIEISRLVGWGVLGLLAYGLMIWLLKVPELRAIFARIKQRLARAG